MVRVIIEKTDFGWIKRVNEILSRRQLGVIKKGEDIYETDYDIILAHFNSNLSLLSAIPETKEILFSYLRVLDRLSITAKNLLNELGKIGKLRSKKMGAIEIEGRVYFYSPEDSAIYKPEEVEMLQRAYQNVQEAFRNLARKYIFTLLSGIEKGRREEEFEQVQQVPEIPKQQTPQYYVPRQYWVVSQQPQQQQLQQQQGGVERGNGGGVG